MGEIMRWLLFALFGVPSGAPAQAQDTHTLEQAAQANTGSPLGDISCDGVLIQGGIVICKGVPGQEITINGKAFALGSDGSAQLGLARKSPLMIAWQSGPFSATLDIKPRHDDVTTINGIPCDKIDARTLEQKAHAARSWEKKQSGWASFNDGRGALDGFIPPSDGRISSPYGFTRSYVTQGCEAKTKVHWGYDIAAPVGTPIIAPAAGVVTLAEDDLYYEGGTVFLDHGHGLMSIFLHMSELDTKVGDVLAAGDAIGKIGATGRVTGPHLHWAVKWRDLSRQDRGGDYYIDPALLLQLPHR